MPRIILYLLSFFFLPVDQLSIILFAMQKKKQHAAGTTMSTPNDPPLSAAGRVRAIELKEVLKR
jgi:hypothetical protein